MEADSTALYENISTKVYSMENFFRIKNNERILPLPDIKI